MAGTAGSNGKACPNGHDLTPLGAALLAVAQNCPICGQALLDPSAFNEAGLPALPNEFDYDAVVPSVIGEVIGWRAWGVYTLGPRIVRLRSVTHKAHWPARDYVYAECYGDMKCSNSTDGKVPGESCTCGLYAARTAEQLEGMSYRLYDSSDEVRIVGQVAMSGKVIVGTQGWRAERARIARLYVPHTHWKLGQKLAEQYNVPVVRANVLAELEER